MSNKYHITQNKKFVYHVQKNFGIMVTELKKQYLEVRQVNITNIVFISLKEMTRYI